jgi:hypothetical protein
VNPSESNETKSASKKVDDAPVGTVITADEICLDAVSLSATAFVEEHPQQALSEEVLPNPTPKAAPANQSAVLADVINIMASGANPAPVYAWFPVDVGLVNEIMLTFPSAFPPNNKKIKSTALTAPLVDQFKVKPSELNDPRSATIRYVSAVGLGMATTASDLDERCVSVVTFAVSENNPTAARLLELVANPRLIFNSAVPSIGAIKAIIAFGVKDAPV